MSETVTKPKRDLTIVELQHAATRLGVTLAAIQAVNAVETNGPGFLRDGRPVILYERHVMYRRLKQAGKDADAYVLQCPHVVNPLRGGYLGGASEHDRLALAQAIDSDCALESCSWGKFQMMGFHWRALGYKSAVHFAELMAQSEIHHLSAFETFVMSDAKLHAALRAYNWAEFARLYNGPTYKMNRYDEKLASAYARFVKGPTSPRPPAPPPPPKPHRPRQVVEVAVKLDRGQA
ncbi:N-acetylmuramidase family protein [Chitinimonas sp. BJB300]|uniref:N-acetylmuramidase family protein n=1 Tax=Chitinimonas sp. BJB300 TaxID=1559339 RepID=UPI000C10E10D|nr:N-acetylmuramidase family protein [Chitinimonas sp. BJB300]PHV11320.1 peptidoglycan-binding protein [Chitinimonas sp. BJB300]TSJ88215.1 N-acetylmuramidase family protein [Chitinimonas sp. BJB300]